MEEDTSGMPPAPRGHPFPLADRSGVKGGRSAMERTVVSDDFPALAPDTVKPSSVARKAYYKDSLMKRL